MNIQRILSIVSVLLFATSFLLPSVLVEGNKGVIYGQELLFYFALLPLATSILFLCSLILSLSKNPGTSLLFSVGSLISGSALFLFTEVSNMVDSWQIISFEIGFYLWLGSFVAAVGASLTAFLNQRKEVVTVGTTGQVG